MIFNHYSAKLSKLDLEIARAIPAGGNWKNVPPEVPSKRLETIRQSYARGEGSRSTYYGRLQPEMPAYTINTYFSRPGNGCHLHYDTSDQQHRVISQREAARLQSFPDSFRFCGSKTSINNQIGNAVPPLLAFQIARQLGKPGYYVDLFSGAGGLALGFEWAGWKSIVANDIDKSALETLNANLGADIICGDIRDATVEGEILRRVANFRKSHPGVPVWVIGGPPCQGFSTAGKARSLDDDRNKLFANYVKILDDVRPDGFLFENVMGLLNMLEGSVFRLICGELSKRADHLTHWLLSAENYGVPQRRHRVIIVGARTRDLPQMPPAITQLQNPKKSTLRLFPIVPGVMDAIDDLPALVNGEDGSTKEYRQSAQTSYQRLMRGLISPHKYCESFKAFLPSG